MGRYDRQNERAVKNGLDWLIKTEDLIARRGMIELLQEASAYAMQLHDATHYGHRISEDSHGWALVKNGTIVMMQVNAGNHGKGDATKQLREVAKGLVNPGYSGIVLASMNALRENGKPIIFEVEFEETILGATADAVRSNFYKFFKPI